MLRRGDFMESVDMKKLETAIVYLQRIADGNNPINNLPAYDAGEYLMTDDKAPVGLLDQLS